MPVLEIPGCATRAALPDLQEMGGAGPRPGSQEFLLTAGGGFKGAQGVGNHTEIVTGMRDWMKVTRPVDYQRLLLSGMYRKKDLPKR